MAVYLPHLPKALNSTMKPGTRTTTYLPSECVVVCLTRECGIET